MIVISIYLKSLSITCVTFRLLYIFVHLNCVMLLLFVGINHVICTSVNHVISHLSIYLKSLSITYVTFRLLYIFVHLNCVMLLLFVGINHVICTSVNHVISHLYI